MMKRDNHIFNALAAMSGAFDIGQDASNSSAIGICRDAIRKGWRYPCDSKAFETMSIEETTKIYNLLQSKHTSYVDIYSTINGMINNRRRIRELEEAKGPQE